MNLTCNIYYLDIDREVAMTSCFQQRCTHVNKQFLRDVRDMLLLNKSIWIATGMDHCIDNQQLQLPQESTTDNYRIGNIGVTCAWVSLTLWLGHTYMYVHWDRYVCTVLYTYKLSYTYSIHSDTYLIEDWDDLSDLFPVILRTCHRINTWLYFCQEHIKGFKNITNL